MKFTEYRQLPKNLFGLLFWNIFSFFIPIFLVLGLLALFGLKPVEFDDKPTYGIIGFFASLVTGPLMSFVTAITVWLLLVIGNLVLRIFAKQKIEINDTKEIY